MKPSGFIEGGGIQFEQAGWAEGAFPSLILFGQVVANWHDGTKLPDRASLALRDISMPFVHVKASILG